MWDKRSKKRIFIISIIIFLFLMFFYFIYQIITPDPSCVDGKKNQNEKDIDCGGACAPCRDISNVQDLSIEEKSFVFGGNNSYDGLIKIKNPNNNIGAASFSYKAKLLDDGGNLLGEKSGQSFILPSETKYLILSGFPVEKNQNPKEIEFEINQLNWEDFLKYQKPQLGIYSKRFNFLTDMVGSEVYGLLKNESSFDFNQIRVNVILRDGENKPVALNSTRLDTVRSGEERDFRLVFPYQIPGEIKNIETEAEADIYNSQNFIKTYISEEKLPFQEF